MRSPPPPPVVRLHQLNKWLSTLLRTKGADIFRSKGILAVMGTDERYVFQGVHMLLDMGSSERMGLNLPAWAPGEKRMNKLCFIGRNLNRDELLAGAWRLPETLRFVLLAHCRAL